MDLVVGCGAWSLPLLALSYTLVGEGGRQWAGVFYALALVANYPHYMATVYRAYGAADRSAHRRYTVHATAVLIALGIVAHGDLRLLPWLFTAYVMWSPWHYSGQNYGLLMMFARRGGLTVTPAIRMRLRLAFVASYVMLLAAFNQGPSADPVVLSLGLPPGVSTAIGALAGAAFLLLGVTALGSLLRGAPARAMAAPLILFITQGLWFVAPVALSWLTSAATPQTRYSSGVLALMHSAQYLVDHPVLRPAGPGRGLGRAALLVGGRPRRHGAVPAGAVARQLRGARGFHGQRAHRDGGRQPAPLHDRRRGLEAARSARCADADRRPDRQLIPGPARPRADGGATQRVALWPSRWCRWRRWTSGATGWRSMAPTRRRSRPRPG